MRSYLMLALKVLQRRKFFTFISLVGISLTLVVLVVATAMLDDLFGPHAPQSRFDRVLMVSRVAKYGPEVSTTMNPGYGFLHDYVLNLPGIERATAFTDLVTSAIYRGGDRIETRIRRTDADYWKILDHRFVEGGPFTAADVQRGAHIAVITDELRTKLFGPGPAAGRSFDLEGDRYRVVGVVEAVPITRIAAYSQLWTPVTTLRTDWQRKFLGEFNGLVLARGRGDFAAIKSEFARRVDAIPIDDPKTYKEIRASIDTPFETFARELMTGPGMRKFNQHAPLVVELIIGIVALLYMTLPALNLVTLNLSRMLERAPEIGVRKAFGAPRTALVSQFVLENVVLTLIGGFCSFVLATAALAAINGSGLIDGARFALNWRVFIWGLGIAVFFGVLSGFYPAWRMSRLHPVEALRGGAK
ncbi:MAG TPA: ABC transporter permease [Thermoanaerobaculia bacterium]|jgi:putative ABC transport system permease protein|nr:ABC transporter permease [Thermoanaerobaculia bacterium]